MTLDGTAPRAISHATRRNNPKRRSTPVIPLWTFMLVMWAVGAIGNNPPIIAATSAAPGLGTIWKFHEPGVRAAHVAGWTGKS